MSRAKLFNLIKSRGENKNGRNPFDLTNRHVYTQKAGKIIPVKALHTYPDDYFEVDMSEFSQNNVPMNTAAFLAGKKELIAYFVPYNSIWHNFNQFMATREDPDSTLLQAKGISYEPRMRLYDLYKAALFFAIGKWFFEDYQDIYILNSAVNAETIQPDLEDGMTGSEILEKLKSIPDVLYPNYSLYDTISLGYRSNRHLYSFGDYSDLYDFEMMCYEYNHLNQDLTYYDSVTDFNGNYVWCDFVQKLDMFGYGNIYPELYTMFNEARRVANEIIEGSVLSISEGSYTLNYAAPDGNTYVISGNSFRMDSEADIPLFDTIFKSTRETLLQMSAALLDDDSWQFEFVNVYPIYGYNKIFYSYMRNVYYDVDYDVHNYNCDFINAKTLEGSIITTDMLPLRWYHLETHQWKKDMFTGVLPDNQLGQVSSLILGDGSQQTLSLTLQGDGKLNPLSLNATDAIFSKEKSIVFTGPTDTTPRDLETNSDYGVVVNPLASSILKARLENPHTHPILNNLTGDETPVNVSLQNGRAVGDVQLGNVELNVLALKRAEAIQQYRQDLMRAGNRTKDVFEQIFGTNPKSELDETPYFIDVASNDINVNAIIASAETGQEINGKLGDIAARSTIAGSSLHFKFSTKDFGCIIFLSYIVPESFYNSYRLDPCITHLDQEAHGLPYFQNLGLQPVIRSYLSNLSITPSVRNSTVGFTPPYIERKTDIDLCHGNLVDLASKRQGVIDMDYQGSLSHWIVARTDMQSEQTVTLRQFYINPRILDNVFTMQAGDDYETDHYLTYCTIKVDAVRAFSQLGLPRF